MKICIINSLYPPDTRGGAERVAQQTANGLCNAGHNVFVIATKNQKNTKITENRIEYIDGIKVYRIPPRNIFTFFDYNKKPLLLRLLWLAIDLVNVFTAREVIKILIQEKPDVVHIHNMRGLSYLLPRSVRKLGIKYIQTLHDIQYAYPSGLLVKGEEKRLFNIFFLRRWYEKFCRHLLGSPDVVISPSKWMMDFYSQRGFFKESQTVVLRNPVNVTRNEQRVTSRRKDELNILFVGQVEKHKGIEFLIKAMKKLPVTRYPLLVMIVGGGTYLTQAKQLAHGNSRIKFIGRIEPRDLAQYYKQADFLVMPTLTYENQPTVILEAFSHGLPVLASNLGGIPELIQERETGWLFKAGDEDGFIRKLNAIVNLFNNQHTFNNLHHNCLSFVSDFSQERYIENLIHIYS